MFILKTLTKKLLKLQILLFLTAKETFLDNLTTIKFKSIQNFAKLWIFHFGIGLLNSLKAKKALSWVTLHQKSPFFGVFRQFSAILTKTSSLYLQICSWMITHSKNFVFKSWKNFVKSSSSSQSILRETNSDMC